jgi:hypothetical protein
MRKRSYFDSRDREGWPDPRALKPYFFAPPGQEWFHTGGNDTAGLDAQGLDETQALASNREINIHLYMCGVPKLGVLLIYDKSASGKRESYSSKGDSNRIGEWVRNLHNDPLPVRLFIPFKSAWLAVKEFIETDGALPKSIDWVANKDLPEGTFPDPGSPHLISD